MTILTIPDDPDALPSWLEQHLLGPDLGRLVGELEVVHGQPRNLPRLADVLGDHAAVVLADGFERLPRSTLSHLLRHPALLPELRDLVLVEGGPYWDRYLGPEQEAAERVADAVRAAVQPTLRPVGPRRSWRWLGYSVTALATAAAVLLGVYLLGWRPSPRSPGPSPAPETAAAGWGFQQVDQLPRNASDPQTLTALADLAAEWDRQKPTNVNELAQRLFQFRAGCAALLLADDLPLSDANRRWLKLRCGDWAGAIDRDLRTLERTRDLAGVQADADRLSTQIVRELRERAGASRS
jgi:hypothetical protein